MARILIIDCDDSILSELSKSLKFYGYDVICTKNAETGLQIVSGKNPPDLIILEVMLSRSDGYKFCQQIRENGFDIPIIILSTKKEEADKLMGFESGADDYVTKPFSLLELLARIKAILRRTKSTNNKIGIFAFDDIEIDYDGYTVTKNGIDIEISQREFDLLTYLISNNGRVLRRETILDEVWGYDYYGTLRTVDNFITHLRQKLEKDPANPQYITTVRGIGYKFNLPTE